MTKAQEPFCVFIIVANQFITHYTSYKGGPVAAQGEYRNFILLVTGQLISKIGSSVYLVAVILFIKQITESPGALGLFQFIAYLPIVVLTPFGGACADTTHKKRIVVWMDILRGAVMICLGLLVFRGILTFSLLLLGTFIISSCTAFFIPAAHALFPEIVSFGRIRKLNSIKNTSVLGANFAGTSVGGIAFALCGPAALFVANGLSFVLSAIPEIGIHYKPHTNKNVSNPSFCQILGKLPLELQKVFRYIKTTSGLGPLLFSYSLVNSIYPPVILSLPFLLEQRYNLGPHSFGVSLACLLAGGGAGAMLYGFCSSKFKYNKLLFFSSLGLLSVLLILLWPFESQIYLWGVLPVAGMMIGVVHQIITTSLYRRVTNTARGRVFGIMESMASFSVPLSYALAGVVIELMQPNLPLFYALIGLILSFTVISGCFFSRIGDFISTDEKPMSLE